MLNNNTKSCWCYKIKNKPSSKLGSSNLRPYQIEILDTRVARCAKIRSIDFYDNNQCHVRFLNRQRIYSTEHKIMLGFKSGDIVNFKYVLFKKAVYEKYCIVSITHVIENFQIVKPI